MSMPEGCVCSPPPDTDGLLPWCPVHGDPEVYRAGKADGVAELHTTLETVISSLPNAWDRGVIQSALNAAEALRHV